MSGPYEVVLELWRGKDAHVDEGHPLGETEYVLRQTTGGVKSAIFPWSHQFHADLEAIHVAGSSQARERVSRRLRDFLVPLGWDRIEAELLQALGAGAPGARVTIRCHTGELWRLPLEMAALYPSGEALGRKERCHIQWEWPGTATVRRTWPAPPEGGVLLFAWSTAGGALDAAAQLRAIQHAARKHGHPKQVEQVPHASLSQIRQALESVQARRQSVAVLHLLCHGAPLTGVEGGHGLSLDGPDGASVTVDPSSVAAALAPHAGHVGCVVLSTCDGANLAGSANVIGSVAQRLHRVGFPAVVASRAPLSSASAQAFTRAFYDTLLAGEPFHRAVSAGRRQLDDEWVAVQAYARAEDGHQYPVVFRPYRGLKPFEARHRRFFFGRSALTRELVQRIHDAAQDEHAKTLRPCFQIVTGPSGAGKSSLVKAGLVPELPSDEWDVIEFRPGAGSDAGSGLDLLAERLGLSALGGDATSPEEFVDTFARLRGETMARRLLLVVDQFEEALRWPRHAAQRFLRALWLLARRESPTIIVLATFRMDLLEAAEGLLLADGVRLEDVVYDNPAHCLCVKSMSPEELLEAIQEPARRAGLQLEPGLAEQLRDDAGEESSALPLLQHALDTLWRERRFGVLERAAYLEFGRLSGALSRRLDGLFDGVPVDQVDRDRHNTRAKHARRLLVELVEFPEDVERLPFSTRRRRRLEDVRPPGAEAVAFEDTVRWLVDERVITLVDGWLDLVHEALIRRWSRLQQWLRNDRADQQLLRELEKVALEWERRRDTRDRGESYLPAGSKLEGFEELECRIGSLSPSSTECLEAARAKRRRNLRRTRLAISALTGGLVMVSVLAVIAVIQYQDKRKAIDKALEVVNEVVFTVDRDLEPLAGVGPVRKKLLDHVKALQATLQPGPDNVESVLVLFTTYANRGDVALSHDDLKQARWEYETALILVEPAAKADPSNAYLQVKLALGYENLAKVAQTGGDLKAARELFSKSFAIREALVKADPSDASLQHNLSVSYNKLGEVAQTAGDLKAAREFFSKGLAIRDALARADPSNAPLQHDLSVSYDKLGEVARTAGDLKATRELFSKGLGIIEGLAKANPSNARFQRDLAASYNNLGEVARAAGDLKAARELVSKGLAIFEVLAKADPSNASLHHDLSLSYYRLGEVAQTGEDLKAARELFSKSLAIIEVLAKADPSNAYLQFSLSVSYTKHGDVAQTAGDLKAAKEFFSKSRDILEALAKVAPSDTSVRRSLSLSYHNLAKVEAAGGNFKAARALLSKSLAIREAMAKADQSNASLQRDLSDSYEWLATLNLDDPAVARAWIYKALDLRRRLARQDVDNLDTHLELANCEMIAGRIEAQAGVDAAVALQRNAAVRSLDRLASEASEGQSKHSEVGAMPAKCQVEAECDARSFVGSPDSPRTLAEVAIDQQDWAPAEKLLRQVVANDSKDYIAWRELGVVLDHFGRSEEAATAYATSLDIHETPQALHNFGLYVARRGNLMLARQMFERAVTLDPEYWQGWALLAQVDSDLDQLSSALLEARRARQLRPLELSIASLLSSIRTKLSAAGVTDEALQHFYVGTTAANEEQNQVAREELQQALKASPRFADAHYNLAIVLRHSGENTAAESEYRAALTSFGSAKSPNRADAQNNLADLLIESGHEIPQARALVTEAIAIRGERAGYLDTLARACDALGDASCALDAFRKLLNHKDPLPGNVRARAENRLRTLIHDGGI